MIPMRLQTTTAALVIVLVLAFVSGCASLPDNTMMATSYALDRKSVV